MTFYSEYGEDRWLYDRGLIPACGVYADIGAAWPQAYSNTALLRDLGWTGVQVDGCDVFQPLWEQLGLKLVVAVISSQPELRYDVNPDHPNLSKISPTGEPMPGKTINQLLSEAGLAGIDLLSVDTEGSEYDVVSSLDFGRHHPRIIIWEYNTLGVRNECLKPFLEQRRYRFLHQTECNYIHAHESAL